MVKFGCQAGKSKYEKVLSPINIYLFFSLLGINLFFIAAFFKRQRIFDWVVMENNSYWVMLDYFRHIRYSQYFGDMYRTIGAIERGNMALYVIVILLNVIIWKDSGIKWKQEAALVLIALVSGLKGYPAILDFFILRRDVGKKQGD